MPIRMGERSALWSWGAVAGLLALAIVQPMACNGSDDGSGPAGALDDVLASVGPDVVRPTLDRAALAAGTLDARCDAWAAALRSGADGAAEQTAAQEAWFAAMDAWQEVEVQQIGPAASSLFFAPGGADLRDEIYSWPTVNRCRVDQETVYATWTGADFFEKNLVNVYGLAALETLLFSPPGANACPSDVDINTDGSWDALGPAGVQQARADYAVVAAGGVRDGVDALVSAWDPAGGDFGGVLAAGEAPFESQQDALQAVFDAMFYLETATKDRKLGRPLGLQDCVGDACASEAESLLAGGSNRWIAANLRSFRVLFAGGDGAGIEDLVRSIGEDALADELLAALDDADAAAALLDVPVHRANADDPEDAIALYDAIKVVTDLVKGDLATVLVISVPDEASGDND